MKVALVYDRLNKIGGAEKVLIALSQLFPEATWYTSLHNKSTAPFTKSWKVVTSPLNKLPFLRSHHDWLAAFMPSIFESFDFSEYDLVISVSSEAAKAVITKPKTIHLNYCLTPTRYLWSHREAYIKSSQFGFWHWLLRPLGVKLLKVLAAWDLAVAQRPDEMIAISEHVKKRINKYYNRNAAVIYPPVETKYFSQKSQTAKLPNDLPASYFLIVARLVPYKNIDTAVLAFNLLPNLHLVIVGEGAMSKSLRAQANPNIHFVGQVAEEDLLGYYAHCQALIHPAEEDFGLVMVEAQACGKPVLASIGGAAKEIIKDSKTGMLYDSKDPQTLVKKLASFTSSSFSASACRQNAYRFDINIWSNQFSRKVASLCKI
jgi:glycosyltransferase involved in cell wall biosynthesis